MNLRLGPKKMKLKEEKKLSLLKLLNEKINIIKNRNKKFNKFSFLGIFIFLSIRI